jgi:hypothetical protein
VPVATRVLLRPATTVAVAGVTAIELKGAAVTVRVAEPDLVPDVAVIVAVPADTPVATPGDATVANEVLPEVQVTLELISTVVPSEKVPVATRVLVRPATTVAVAGVTAIELKVAAVTVRVAEPVLPPKAAVMTDEPADTPVATPGDATVATKVSPEVQVTLELISTVVPSE